MPIMNGFEACKKINNLFQKDQLFHHEKSLLVKVESNMNLQDSQQMSEVGVVKINHQQSNIPLLVAQSSNPKTKALERKLNNCGFN